MNASLPSGGEVILVTPDMAREWLLTNTHNRHPRSRAVTRYAADMAAGEWPWTCDPIRFSKDGVLLDGQHRLLALIEANVTLPFLVVRGLEPKAQESIDSGVARKFSDVLRLRNEDRPDALAAVTRLATEWMAGTRRSLTASGGITPAQMLHTLEDHPELREATRPELRTIGQSAGLAPSYVAFCWWLFNAIDPEDAEFFIKRLGEATGHEKGDPIYELRRTLSVRRRNDTASRLFALVVTIKAWNAFRAGESVGLYRWRAGGANPEAFPEPK